MTQRLRIMRTSTVNILAAAALAGCAVAPPRQAMDTSQPVSSAGAQVTLGIVASVRPVSISVAKVGAMASINAVLGALSQRYIEPPVAGEEIVIRRDDGNTAAIVEQDEAVSLVAGDRVALIVSSPAVIIRRN